MEQIKLTTLAQSSGCAAKLSPSLLNQVLSRLTPMHSDKLLGGFEKSDDALVYQLDGQENRLLLQTVDFFPPMVDDPYTFGQVAAANALSDIWAMGGEPAVCLNIVCFPNTLDIEILTEILKGGQDKAQEAGAVIAGGHSIVADVPTYGLSVTGFVDRDKLWTNANAQVGDALILTKALGVGIITTAIKGERATESSAHAAIQSMTRLNKYAREQAQRYTIHAATDVTGFSLLGHGFEMAEASLVTIRIDTQAIPILEDALLYTEEGFTPGGLYRNREYLKEKVHREREISPFLEDILYDPQTSGGLLLALPKQEAEEFSSLSGYPIIGEVLPAGEKRIVLV
jgi:selenide,water dikinase